MFFTSDTHFFHSNIIKYCPSSRGMFNCVEEMNEIIIHNWNSVVNDSDIIYHLGDFSFNHNKQKNKVLFNRLKGKKILIKGNHDVSHITKLDWMNVYDYLELHSENIVLMHYPFESWNRQSHNAISLHGHRHSNNIDNPEKILRNRLDVGVDNTNLTPIHIDEVRKIINERS